jgi:hypothetical protein
MMHADDETMNNTRRCLFPAGDGDSELLRNEMKPYRDPEFDDLFQYQRSSPTSVSDHPVLSPNSKERSLRSTITMSEHGAEVTLILASMSLATPDKIQTGSFRRSALGEVRGNSLMDVDCTPTPPAAKTPTSRNFGICCTKPTAQCYQEEEYQVAPNFQLEQTITGFLGESGSSNPFSGCHEWQAWSFFLSEDCKDQNPSMENIRSNLRNRAFSLGARKSRVRQLRQDCSPFAGSPRRSPAPKLFRSRSFSVSDHAPGIVRVSKDKKRTSFTNVLQLCMLPENATAQSPMVSQYNVGDKGDICYDSDPEDFTRRKSPGRGGMDKENILDSQRYTYPMAVSSSPTGKIDDAYNEHAFHAVVQELFNSTSTLLFHPTDLSCTDAMKPSTPVGVDAWLERGQRLCRIIQPKWMWRSKPRTQTGGQHVQMHAVCGIELLDITRILKVHRSNLDREKYPFAKPSNCFLIKTIYDEEFCFEAKSLAERERLVYSFKMVIARFGAKVLVADESLYTEFFATTESCVPGEAPRMPGLHDSDDNWDDDSDDNFLSAQQDAPGDDSDEEMFESFEEEC